MDMYLGKKECSKFKLGLGEEAAQQLTRPMEKSFLFLFQQPKFGEEAL